MATIKRSGARHVLAAGVPAPHYKPGFADKPELFGFALIERDGGRRVNVEIDEFELRRLLVEWTGLVQSKKDHWLNALPDLTV